MSKRTAGSAEVQNPPDDVEATEPEGAELFVEADVSGLEKSDGPPDVDSTDDVDSSDVDSSDVDSTDVDSIDEEEDRQNRGIFEALLIASDDPLPVGRIVGVIKGVGAKDVRRMVDDLNTAYLDSGRAFTITEVAGGFQFAVHREYASWVRQLAREKSAPRLSIAALESLAVIAFRQPVTKIDVEEVRGVSVDGVLRHLLEKGLIRIAGRAEGPGRPLLYGTTRAFLKHFGLKTLSDLPKPREIEDLLKEREGVLGGPPRQSDEGEGGDESVAEVAVDGNDEDGDDAVIQEMETHEETAADDEQADDEGTEAGAEDDGADAEGESNPADANGN